MTIWLWLGFLGFILIMLALDLGVFNRNAHNVNIKEATAWTIFWVALSLIFNGLIYYMYEHHWLGIGREIGHVLSGKQAAVQFFTGYIIEKSLSLDNIFVIALIFAYFKVPARYQHRVLFWGILGAIVMRGIMIFAGAILISRFSWMVYVFGGLLIVTAVKMLFSRHDNLEPAKNPLVKLAQRLYPVTNKYYKKYFFVRIDQKIMLTPLFLALIVIESSDVIFAIDSIPAIFAVTRDPFLVFTSNIFAILGLRSMYFALAAMMEKFRYLKLSLVFILAYVGLKMILSHLYPIPTGISLAVIAAILILGILASVYRNYRDRNKPAPPSSNGKPTGSKPLEKMKENILPGNKSFRIQFATSMLFIILAITALSCHARAQRYAGIWEESFRKERILADATWATFEETNKKLMAKKFRLEEVEIYDSNGQKKYSAVWHSGTDSSEIYFESWIFFQEKIAELNGKNLRLNHLETYLEGNERKFFGVWRQGDYKQKVEAGLTWDEFQRLWEQYGKDDLRLVDVETYLEDRVRKYAGVWKEGTQDYRLWRDLDWKTFYTIWQGLKEQHFHLVDMETYVTNNERKFMGVWLKKDTDDHRIVVDLNWNDFMAKWQEYGKDNVWLIDLEIY